MSSLREAGFFRVEVRRRDAAGEHLFLLAASSAAVTSAFLNWLSL